MGESSHLNALVTLGSRSRPSSLRTVKPHLQRIAPSLNRTGLHQYIAIAVTSAVILAVAFGWHPSPTVSLGFGIAAVLVGMPHGALDVAIGPRLLHWMLFFPLYGLLFAATIATWLVAPLPSLIVFLLLSWFHFGAGDSQGWNFPSPLKALRGIATGGLVLGLPMARHYEIVTPIFSTLQRGGNRIDSSSVRAWGLLALAVAVPAAVVCAVLHLRNRDYLGAVELVLLVGLGTFASPLIAFATYFAVWHSPRHIIEAKPTRASLRGTVIATVATLIGAAAVWISMKPSIDTAIQVVFIGLAGLTVPHLLVTAGVRSGRSRRLRLRRPR
jgi:beta-carotene 15,15'-dioxygenase